MKKISVKVKPNSSQQRIEPLLDGGLQVWLKSPPVDGKANQELIEVLAAWWSVSKGKIQIKSGHNSRQKLILVDDGDN